MTSSGGGVLLLEGHLTMLEGSEISHNDARFGAGVQVGAGSTLIGKSSFIGYNGRFISGAGAQIFLGGGGWFHMGYGSADSVASGLPDPKVELFDMTIVHTCQWDIPGVTWMGSQPSMSSAFGYSMEWLTDGSKGWFGFGEVSGIDRPVNFEGKALDIRNSRMSVSECDDMMAQQNQPLPAARRQLQSTPTELGVGLPPNALPRCADQTVMNPTTGVLQPICGLEATCTDTPLLAPLPPSPPAPPLLL
jgi:hypothetical protein